MTAAERLRLEMWLLSAEQKLRKPDSNVAFLLPAEARDALDDAARKLATLAEKQAGEPWPAIIGEGIAELCEIIVALEGRQPDAVSFRLWSAWGALTNAQRNEATRLLPAFMRNIREFRPIAMPPTALAYLAERRWEHLPKTVTA